MRRWLLFGLFILIAVTATRVSLRGGPAVNARAEPDAAAAPRAVASEDQVVPTAPRKQSRAVPKAKLKSRADATPEELLARKPKRVGPVGSDDPSRPPLERYRGLRLGAEVKFGRRGFRPLAARAIKPERYSPSFGPVLFEELGRRVVALDQPDWADLTVTPDGQPLMVNPNNGRLALVTGTLEVSVGGIEVAEALAAAENLTLINYDRTIGLAFLRAPPDYALAPAVGRIGKFPGVSGVELELFEGQKVAQ